MQARAGEGGRGEGGCERFRVMITWLWRTAQPQAGGGERAEEEGKDQTLRGFRRGLAAGRGGGRRGSTREGVAGFKHYSDLHRC